MGRLIYAYIISLWQGKDNRSPGYIYISVKEPNKRVIVV